MKGLDQTMPIKIVSGGQSGVDRAALDVALELGIPCGGWCPAGRAAEDGPLDARYPLRETRSEDPAERTARNVEEADGLLVLTRGEPRGGTARAMELATRANKPVFVVDVDHPPRPEAVRAWVQAYGMRTVNVAGPRESESPGIGGAAAAWLREWLG